MDALTGDTGPTAPDPVLAAAAGAPAPRAPGRRLGTLGVVLRGGSWNLLGQLVPVAVAVFLTPFVVHHLGIERYGLFALATSITTFLSSFDGGLRPAAQRFLSVFAGRADVARTTRLLATLTLLVAGLGAVVFTVLWLLGPALLALFRVPTALRGDGVFVLRTLAITVSLQLVFGLYTALLNAHQRFALTNAARIGSQLAYAAGVVLALSAGAGLRGVALVLLGQSLLSAVVLVPSACRLLSREHLGLMPREELAEVLRFSGRVQVTAVAGLVNLEADTLIIGAFAPVAAVGLYSVGAQFAAQLRSVPTNALGPVHTTLARVYGERGEEASRAELATLQRYWVVAVTGWLSVGAGAAFFGVLAWLGEGYRLSAEVAALLLLGHTVNMWTGVLTLWLGAVGRPELEARYGVVGMLLNVVLTLALVVPFGIIGVVAATMAGQVLGSLYLLRLVRARLGTQVRSFLRDVPVIGALCALVTTVAVEYLGMPLCPSGGAGLVVAGALAVPGLAVFAAVVLPRSRWADLAGTVLGRSRPGGRVRQVPTDPAAPADGEVTRPGQVLPAPGSATPGALL